MNTRQKLQYEFGNRVLYNKDKYEDNKCDVVAMDRGKFVIKDTIGISVFNDYLVDQLNKGDRRFAAVQSMHANDISIVWFDIDNLYDFNISDIVKTITDTIYKKYPRDLNVIKRSIYITKRKNMDKFHIYVNGLNLKRSTRKELWESVNTSLGENVIDVNATNIRFDGFLKYEQNKYTPDSYYAVVTNANQKISWSLFYSKVNILQTHESQGWVLSKTRTLPLSHSMSFESNNNNNNNNANDILSDNECNNKNGKNLHMSDNNNSNSQMNGEFKEHEYSDNDNDYLSDYSSNGDVVRSSDDDDDIVPDMFTYENHFNSEISNLTDALSQTSVSGVLTGDTKDEMERCTTPEVNKIMQTITINYPHLATTLYEYDIDKIAKKSKSIIIFSCSKSEKSRKCPFIPDHTHTKASNYIVYYTNQGKLVLKCHAMQCLSESRIIWTSYMSQQNLNKNELLEGTGTDKQICELFTEFDDGNYLYSFCDGDPKGFYFYNGKFWQHDEENLHIIKHVSTEFSQWCKNKFNDLIDRTDDPTTRDRLMASRKNVIQACEMTFKQSGFKEMLKSHIPMCKRKRWNSLPDKLVFPNGVLDIQTREFGASEKNEYINDNMCMGCLYVQRDDQFIQDVLITRVFSKVFPIEAHMWSYLMYLSLALEGRNRRHCAINIGTEGNNGKSKNAEMVLCMMGSYGSMGDNKFLLKGKKDRATIANMHRKRFMIFEEPDQDRSIDINRLKAWVGGSDTHNARQLYKNGDQIEICSSLVINMNGSPIMAADKALISRLHLYKWITQFVKDPALVDEPNFIYLVDNEVGERPFWELCAPQLLHLLLDQYEKFLNSKPEPQTLYIPEQIKIDTKQFICDNDMFALWFDNEYQLLRMGGPNDKLNKKQFVTLKEIEERFTSEYDTRIFSRSITSLAYIKKEVKKRDEWNVRFSPKPTNWRVDYEIRKTNTSVNIKSGKYAPPALMYCISKDAHNFGKIPSERYAKQKNISSVMSSRPRKIPNAQNLKISSNKRSYKDIMEFLDNNPALKEQMREGLVEKKGQNKESSPLKSPPKKRRRKNSTNIIDDTSDNKQHNCASELLVEKNGPNKESSPLKSAAKKGKCKKGENIIEETSDKKKPHRASEPLVKKNGQNKESSPLKAPSKKRKYKKSKKVREDKSDNNQPHRASERLRKQKKTKLN